MFQGIDLYSDTITRPTPAMRKAIAEAVVGDEQKGEDPTTRALEEKTAELLGHTSAMFFPSATMANEVAILLHCEPGDEILAAEQCHIFFAEAGGPAFLARAMARPIHSENGKFTGERIRATYRYAKGSHYPVSKLVSVENTTNMGGGVPWTAAELADVIETSKSLEMKTHMDGARLMNACVATGLSPKKVAGPFDTVTLCLSKGLGCPAGAVLAFDIREWARVRRFKQLLGGALRQSGILAAAGLYALENNIARLAEDHQNAKRLATLLHDIDGLRVENSSPDSNMVFFRWDTRRSSLEVFLRRCEDRGVRFSGVGVDRVRAVTHLDIKAADIEKVAAVVREVAKEI